MKVKTSELDGAALDFAVTKSSGIKVKKYGYGLYYVPDEYGTYRYAVGGSYSPSKQWEQAGPIIEQQKMEFDFIEDEQCYLAANGVHAMRGPTHLIAAMRCYVASKMGDTIEVPDELI